MLPRAPRARFPPPRPPTATAAAFALRATLALEPLGVRGLQLCQQRGLRRCSRSGRALPQPEPLGPDAVRPKGCAAPPTLGRNSSCTVAAPVAAFISIGQLVVTGGTTSGPAGCSARARLFASACSAAARRIFLGEKCVLLGGACSEYPGSMISCALRLPFELFLAAAAARFTFLSPAITTAIKNPSRRKAAHDHGGFFGRSTIGDLMLRFAGSEPKNASSGSKKCAAAPK